ncbi:hypothetical protein ACFWTE_06480 [Nocardiopsis sp. NPDC058631]|uniref:hypothetical protein n=1 Tax=Nocardiopsis sp. NPDC058631 TaxID=3346566 RepID=UPI0036521A55
MTWQITPTEDNGHPAVSFQRPWENTPTTLRVLDLGRVRADLQALERIEQTNPGWYVGFLHRNVPVTHLDGLWAQHPGDVLVQADTADALVGLIAAAKREHGL